jgi:PleD family two-component response regulator
MLGAGHSSPSITVGLARLQTGDSADDLIQRADDEVSTARKRR